MSPLGFVLTFNKFELKFNSTIFVYEQRKNISNIKNFKESEKSLVFTDVNKKENDKFRFLDNARQEGAILSEHNKNLDKVKYLFQITFFMTVDYF